MARLLRGSVIKKNSKYYIVVELERSADGKRRQKWLSDPLWTTKKAAEKDLPRVLFEVSRGVVTTGKPLELSELLNKWQQVALGDIRPASERAYRWAIDHIKTALGNIPINKLTPYQLQNFIHQKQTSGLSPTSVRLIVSVLQRALAQAQEWRLIAASPADKIKRPRPADFKAGICSAAQLKQLIESTAGTPAGLAIHLAAACGLRRGEACALRWGDVDLANGVLRIEHTAHEAQGISPVKTDKSRRAVTLPAGLLEVLRQAFARYQAERSAPGYVDYGFVIARPDGNRYTPAFIYQGFKQAAAAIGAPNLRLHDLRHSHATHLLAAGVPIKAVSERLGHYSAAFTLDRYVTALPSMQDQATAAIEKLLGDSATE